MKYALLLCLALGPIAFGQSESSGQATVATGTCSVANKGNENIFKINCGIGQKQGDALLKLVNQILAKEPDLTAMMAKLDECLKGIPQHRHLTEQQKHTLQSAVASFPNGLIVVSHVEDPEAEEYSREFKSVLGVKFDSSLDIISAETFRGIRVGAPYNDTNMTFYRHAEYLADAMQKDGFPEVTFVPNRVSAPTIEHVPGMPAGSVFIVIGSAPLAH